jgi:glucan biosynthesis protein C
MNSVPPSPRGRLAYIDWLRFFVVLSLAPFHAAISFTGMGSVFVYDTPVRDILLAGGTPVNLGPCALYFTIFIDNWFINLLFLISGIGAAISLRKRTGAQFLGERCNRLLLPLLICTPLVISVQSWLRALSFGRFSGSFFAFFPLFFNGIYTGPRSSGNFDLGHLWFLEYLFVFSALALSLFLSIQRKGEGSRILSIARRFTATPLILLPALWTGFLEALLRPGWPGWPGSLINDWAIFTVNLSFFLAGYVVGSVPELSQAIEKHRLAALLLGITAFLARIAPYGVVAVPDGYNAANMIAQAFRGIAAYGLVMAAIGYGQRYLNRPGRMLGIARDLSFPLYILHYAPLTVATYLLLNSGLSIWTRWILAVAASWSFVVLFTFLARFVPPVRSFFSIRQPQSKRRENLASDSL